MQWTDRIRQVKIILVVSAVVIAVASLVVSNSLVRELAQEERDRMEIWAEAMRSLSTADVDTDLNLVLKVINRNNTIPVVVTGDDGQVHVFRNMRIEGTDMEDSMRNAARKAARMMAEGKVIRIALDDGPGGEFINVCYDDSIMLKRLASYPYVQLGVVMLFVVVAIFALLTSKRAEQNKVWVGLSKETAHQLGTPISSLMAWTEILRETYPDDGLIPEMGKDVKRLELVAERFSKIGSRPELSEAGLKGVMEHVMDYMQRRTSSRVRIVGEFPVDDITARINAALFEWVIENLCKNAVDAIEGDGLVTLRVEGTAGKAIVEVSDTGKGIRKKDIDNVFRPGFTTKERGWGLGLSLAKRIIEEYHRGRIFVKCSEVGRGTTFRIELRA